MYVPLGLFVFQNKNDNPCLAISKMCTSLLFSVAKWVIIVILVALCIQYWIDHKSYLSSHEKIADTASKYGKSAQSVDQSIEQLKKELRNIYPGHILPEKDMEWIFINAGGWMGSMCILYASLTEYILVFGTAMETSGNSGRYWANITDTLLAGNMLQWKEGSLHSQAYHAGETVYHSPGEVTGIYFEANTWMVEYARGFIPSALPFALADTVFSSTDVVTIFYTLRIYAKALWQEFGMSWVELKDYVKQNM